MTFGSRFLRSLLATVALVVVVGAIFTGGAWVGSRNPQALPEPIRDLVVDPDGPGSVTEAFGIIRDQYYREPSAASLRDDGIDGMVDGLDDRFSGYFTPKEYAQFQQSQDNRFDGIGVVVGPSAQGLQIAEVYPESPAEEAGLKPGDVITAADGRSLKGLPADRASTFVRGPAGTKVELTVQRKVAGKTRELKITSERRPVEVPIVDSTLRTEDGTKVGVVRLAQFTNGAAIQVATAFEKLRKRGATRFVLDLRSNPGGLVTQAQGVASLFLDGGIVVTLRGREIGEQVYEAGKDPLFPKIPLVVAVNEGSASAAEIVSGALQDRDRATIVGGRTYGKGVFQRVVPLSSGGALDITAGQYFTPKNRNLGGTGTKRGKGLAPDIKAEDDPKTPEVDESLDRAIEVASQAKVSR